MTDEDDRQERKGDRDDVRELVEVGRAVAEGQEATKEAIVRSITADNQRFRRRNAALLTAVFLLLLMQGFQTYRSIFQTGPLLARLDDNQEGIDSLVSFVRDFEDAQEEGGTDPTTIFIELLCSTQDEVRQATCVELGLIPAGG